MLPFFFLPFLAATVATRARHAATPPRQAGVDAAPPSIRTRSNRRAAHASTGHAAEASAAPSAPPPATRASPIPGFDASRLVDATPASSAKQVCKATKDGRPVILRVRAPFWCTNGASQNRQPHDVTSANDADCAARRGCQKACTPYNCANRHCHNRAVWALRWRSDDFLAVYWTGCKERGYGLYTTVDLEEDAFIIAYLGEEISYHELKHRYSVAKAKQAQGVCDKVRKRGWGWGGGVEGCSSRCVETPLSLQLSAHTSPVSPSPYLVLLLSSLL